MIRLLRTNYFKMFRSWSFWLTLILMPFVNIFTIINQDEYYLGLRPESGLIKWNIAQCPDSCFSHMEYITFFVVILVGMLIGDEYSSGSIRNKIVAGYSRKQIYTSYVITSITECVLVHLFCVFFIYTICILRYGFDNDYITIISLTYRSLTPVIALSVSAVFCIVTTGDRIVGMVITFVGDLAVYLFISGYIYRKLLFENTKVSIMAKKIMVIIDSLIPSSYSNWFVTPMRKAYDMGVDKMPSCLWCVIPMIIFVIIGALVFNKRDIK